MNPSVHIISFANLALGFIPAAAVVLVLYRWSLGYGKAIYALARMLVQLMIIGYFLTFIFQTQSPWIVLSVVIIMLGASSWIATSTRRSTILSRNTGTEATICLPGLGSTRRPYQV